jgi:hypothetical protein
MVVLIGCAVACTILSLNNSRNVNNFFILFFSQTLF